MPNRIESQSGGTSVTVFRILLFLALLAKVRPSIPLSLAWFFLFHGDRDLFRRRFFLVVTNIQLLSIFHAFFGVGSSSVMAKGTMLQKISKLFL
jgi:hypothetical protein